MEQMNYRKERGKKKVTKNCWHVQWLKSQFGASPSPTESKVVSIAYLEQSHFRPAAQPQEVVFYGKLSLSQAFFFQDEHPGTAGSSPLLAAFISRSQSPTTARLKK